MTERAHTWLAAGAALVLAGGFFGWRALGDEARGPVAAVPNPGLAPLAAYAAPVADTVMVRPTFRDSMVLRRDPFASQPMSRVADIPVSSPIEAPPKVEDRKWDVSAILIGGVQRAAIINDELFHVGDSLPGGMKLTSVERDRVVLTDARGTAHTIAVREGEG